MDDTVNNFLKEINEIAPPLNKIAQDCAWEECLDQTSGFPYYWNISTNEVTWEIPKEYKIWLENTKDTVIPIKKSINDGINKTECLLSSKEPVVPVPSNVKIYKMRDQSNQLGSRLNKTKEIKSVMPVRKKSSDSEDEKIVLISSYGGDTDSEEENVGELPKFENGNNLKLQKSTSNSISSSRKNSDSEEDDEEDDDEESILEKIQNRAKLLKALGGDIPSSVQSLVSNDGDSEDHKKTGFSLIAGYGNDSDEEDESLKSPVLSERIAHSTLFPIPEAIDLNQFIEHKTVEISEEKEEIDTKAFQRKRRIGIHLVNTLKRPRDPETPISDKPELISKTSSNYPRFVSGGISFLKPDALNPLIEQPFLKPGSVDPINNEIEDIQVTLKEKLAFLSEGRDLVSPVQVMIIQMDTLHVALKAGSLTESYFNKWLQETCEELIKLELDAAPNGWLLQWDRSQKRYYYKHQTTHECQWEFPKPVEDDAMDICTTPPPPPSDDAIEIVVRTVAPPPPKIHISPPPPPIISEMGIKDSIERSKALTTTYTLGEPLPPGVDPEPHSEMKKNSEDLSSVLDSFYSDIAAIENTAPSADVISSTETITHLISIGSSEPVKKKKKVKMAQGLSMKKKDVSKLVEKWKNVQKNLD